MKLSELETYYFCTPDLNRVRMKYFSTLNNMIGVENFFNNEKLTDENHWNKLTDIIDCTMDFIYKNEVMRDDFINAYKTSNNYLLGELIIQSLVADVAIQLNLQFNIFKDKRSILYFENDYPTSIRIYKNKNKSGSMFEYIDFFENLQKELTQIPLEEILYKYFLQE